MSTRVTFATARAAEFLERRALQGQTGRAADEFGEVIVKELLDNALDAAESGGIPPEIELRRELKAGLQYVTVADNGTGLPADVVTRILDFNVLVSDKAAYRSPTRGLQGNAFKTIIGIPYALGVAEPIVIEARGIRHEIAVSIDPGGNVVVRHDRADSPRIAGTAVTVPLPRGFSVDVERWMQGFALVNPHATLIHQANGDCEGRVESYKPTVDASSWSKPLPTDRLQPHWYDVAAFTKLVYAHIGAARNGGRDLPLGEFIRTFDGLSSTAKAKTVRSAVPAAERLSDFEARPEMLATLLAAMKDAVKPPKPRALGMVPEAHYRTGLHDMFGVERFWFKRGQIEADGIAWVFEVALAETAKPGRVFYGVNYSASFGDPLGQTHLQVPELDAVGAGSFLARCGAYPRLYDNDGCRAVVMHVICAAPEHTDKGKVALSVPQAVAEQAAQTLAAAARTLRAEHRRAERDARTAREGRDPRGELREPHTAKTVRLGTREVAEYILPRHVFDKILYVEKEGLNPIFEAAKLAERYDMAIASGKGQPVEAVRELFARAGAGNYRLYVLHDADHAGYVIRRAIAEETARMPHHRVEVVDLGLTVADAIKRGLRTERYTRRVELPWWMPDRLTDAEREWFEGRRLARKQWECTRVELNALGSAGLVELVESGLRRHRATNKVVPPRRVITDQARTTLRSRIAGVAEDIFRELGLDIDNIADEVARGFHKPHLLRIKQSLLNRRLRGNSPRPWDDEVRREVLRRLDASKVETRVRKVILDRLAQQGGDAA